MPRPKLQRSSSAVYHVAARANNGEFFPVSGDGAWRIGCKALAQAAERYGAEIHAFVQMSNHLHLLLSTPNANVDSTMRYFLSQFACRVNAVAERSDHLWAARYKWSLLDSPAAVAYVLKYVLRNPVRAGLSATVQSYPFSSYFPDQAHPVAIVEGMGPLWQSVPKSIESRRDWLNQHTEKELEAIVGRALRRSRFAFSKSTNLAAPTRKLEAAYGVLAPSQD